MIGAVVLLFVIYSVWFLTGRPSPSVDYLARLNAMSRPEIAAEDNAWTDYDRALRLLVEEEYEVKEVFRVAGARGELSGQLALLSTPEREALTAWLEANGPAWEAFAAGTSKPYCYRAYHGDPNDEGQPWLLSVLLNHLSGLRKLSRAGIWNSRLAAEAGRIEEALDHCLAVARGAAHWQTRKILIEQLVGVALSRMAHQEILSLLETHELSAAQLGRVQTELAAIHGAGYPAVDVSFERLAFLDTVQHVFTNGGPGGGHLVPREAAYVMDDLPLPGPDTPELEVFLGPLLLGVGMAHARRNATIEKANALYDHMEAYATLTPYERRHSDLPAGEALLSELSRVRYALVWTLYPAVDRAAEIGFRGQALHEATLTALALHRWRLEKGDYPDRLADLVEAGYLARAPADPYTDGPLVYRVKDDSFTLYSMGPNFEDDGGMPGYDRKGRPSTWHEEKADAVFWPIRKSRD
jgi:hypothetical protein